MVYVKAGNCGAWRTSFTLIAGRNDNRVDGQEGINQKERTIDYGVLHLYMESSQRSIPGKYWGGGYATHALLVLPDQSRKTGKELLPSKVRKGPGHWLHKEKYHNAGQRGKREPKEVVVPRKLRVHPPRVYWWEHGKTKIRKKHPPPKTKNHQPTKKRPKNKNKNPEHRMRNPTAPGGGWKKTKPGEKASPALTVVKLPARPDLSRQCHSSRVGGGKKKCT